MVPGPFFHSRPLDEVRKGTYAMSLKGKSKKLLLRGDYYNVPSPVGDVKVNAEVWLHVQIRVDPKDNDADTGGEGRGDDVLGRQLEELVARLTELLGSAKKATATEERIVQIELFEGLAPGRDVEE